MEKTIIAKWDKNKGILENWFKTTKQDAYDDYSIIVTRVIELVLNEADESPEWNVKEITEVDNGDYQGTKLFLFHKDTYQPSMEDYAIVDVSYGSCSGCDTLQGISEYDNELPTEEQVKQYMTLALQIVQSIKFLEFSE